MQWQDRNRVAISVPKEAIGKKIGVTGPKVSQNLTGKTWSLKQKGVLRPHVLQQDTLDLAPNPLTVPSLCLRPISLGLESHSCGSPRLTLHAHNFTILGFLVWHHLNSFTMQKLLAVFSKCLSGHPPR